MLADPGQSPYDLNFSLFGIPVRVHPWFWLISALFVWDSSIAWGLDMSSWDRVHLCRSNPRDRSRLDGQSVPARYIVLYGFGGLAVGSNNLSRAAAHRRLVRRTAAQFMLYGLCGSESIRVGLRKHLEAGTCRCMLAIYLINCTGRSEPVCPCGRWTAA